MTGFQLAASLASSLAWPTVIVLVLVFAWIKRAEIGSLLTYRPTKGGRSLKRLRAGPLELEWDELIESTAEAVPETEGPKSVPAEKSVEKKLASIANIVPAAAVLEAFSRVEQRLREITEPLSEAYSTSTVSGYSRRRHTARWMAKTALTAGIINENIYNAILI